jgi:L(+)-tartrate dehydratase beta subunit
MATHEVTFPITDESEFLKLRAGDEVVGPGAHHRHPRPDADPDLRPGRRAADDLAAPFLLPHAHRRAQARRTGGYDPVCIGTTTSARMVRFTEPLGAQYGVRAICGKGGFPDEAIEPMRKHGMVYFAIVRRSGRRSRQRRSRRSRRSPWEELMPECLWKFRVKDFGPLTVGIDAHGNSLYHDVQAAATKKLEELYAQALTDSSTCPRAPASRRTEGPHARDRQGHEPARHRGHVRHGRPVRRHRQARLGARSYVTHNLEQKLALLPQSRRRS